ncbi:MAG: 50S ribosomal protein L32 [Chloroflexota bacterium]|nr:50S ribosomal protein L32 [Chloroflexota bacterium]MDE2952190.1 50S ribosomal protein L32 [Chloroflexota bacterium]
MGPLPKRKVSKSRRDRRRAHHALTLNHLVECEDCGEYRISHRVCPKCGAYGGEKVMEVKGD